MLLEVSFTEVNAKARLLAKAVDFIASRGFEVCEAMELHRRPLGRAANQVDLLFVPYSSPLLSNSRRNA